LEHSDVDRTLAFVTSSPELADRSGRDLEEGSQTFPPLVSKLLAVYEY